MKNDLFFYIIGLAVIVAFIVFVTRKNKMDKKKLETQIKRDYHKSPKHETGEDPDDLKGS